MSEYSVGVQLGHKEVDIPTFVPTLTPAEIQTLLTMKPGDKIPDSIIDKAITHAESRLAGGKPVFADIGEQMETIHPQFPRAAVKLPSGDIRLPGQVKR